MLSPVRPLEACSTGRHLTNLMRDPGLYSFQLHSYQIPDPQKLHKTRNTDCVLRHNLVVICRGGTDNRSRASSQSCTRTSIASTGTLTHHFSTLKRPESLRSWVCDANIFRLRACPSGTSFPRGRPFSGTCAYCSWQGQRPVVLTVNDTDKQLFRVTGRKGLDLVNQDTQTTCPTRQCPCPGHVSSGSHSTCQVRQKHLQDCVRNKVTHLTGPCLVPRC